MDEEIWKDIEGYEGYYQVSNIGRVKSLDRKVIRTGGVVVNFTGKIRKLTIGKRGYLGVRLSKNGKLKQHNIHKLVASEFIINTNDYPMINHIDGNKLNNKTCNLEWCTSKHNVRHSHMIGTANFYCFSKNGKPKPKPVIQFDINGKLISKYNSISEASRITGASLSLISKCCNNYDGRKTAGGYVWKFADTKGGDNL